jgi:hypothetical protein
MRDVPEVTRQKMTLGALFRWRASTLSKLFTK